MGKVGDIILLSFFWSILSLTVILISPASAGIYYATVKSVRSEYGTAWKEMLKSVKINLKQGILLSIMVVLYSAVIILGIRFSSAMLSAGTVAVIYWVLIRLMIIPGVLVLTWAYPLMGRFSMGIKDLLKNSIIISMKEFQYTLLLWGFMLVCGYFIVSIPILTFFIPGMYTLVVSYPVEKVLKKYTTAEAEQNSSWHVE